MEKSYSFRKYCFNAHGNIQNISSEGALKLL